MLRRWGGGKGRQALQGRVGTEAVLGTGTEDTTRWASFRAGQATCRLEASYERLAGLTEFTLWKNPSLSRGLRGG